MGFERVRRRAIGRGLGNPLHRARGGSGRNGGRQRRQWRQLRRRLREVYQTVRIVAAFVAFSALIGVTQDRAISVAESGRSQNLGRRPTPQPVRATPRTPRPSTQTELREPAELWLVDGFNVLNVAILRGPEREEFWSPAARARLLSLVERFPGAADVVVVFDGSRPATAQETEAFGPRAVFAPDADEWLLRAVRDFGEPTRVAVVTADRRLAARARHRGARVISPGHFVAACGSEAPEPAATVTVSDRRADIARDRRGSPEPS